MEHMHSTILIIILTSIGRLRGYVVTKKPVSAAIRLHDAYLAERAYSSVWSLQPSGIDA